MAIFELINLRKARKAILYLLCIVVAIWMQTMLLSRVTLLGVKAFFLPALIVAFGLFEGGVWGGMLGLAAGLGCMLSMAGSPVLFLVLLPVFGFLSGLLADFLINRRFVAYLLLCALALLVTSLLQALWALPLAVPAYFAAKLLAGYERERA